MEVTVLSGQTLADIAIQVYGSTEGVFILAVENGLDVTADLEPGQILSFQPENIIDKSIVEYYSMNGIHPATAFIGNWRIFDYTFDYTFN